MFTDKGGQKLKIFKWSHSKRSLEQGHVFLWAVKDFLWIRAWTAKWIVGTGIAALSLQLCVLHIDFQELRRELRNGSLVERIEALEEVFLTMSMLFWLISNTWWSYGECTSLNESAVYDEFYDTKTRQAESIIFASIFCVICYIAIAITRGFLPTDPCTTPRIVEIEEDPETALTIKIMPPSSSMSSEFDDDRAEPVMFTQLSNVLDRAHLLLSQEQSSSEDLNLPTSIPTPKRRDSISEMRHESDGRTLRLCEEAFLFLWILKDFTWMIESKWAWTVDVILISCCLSYVFSSLVRRNGVLTLAGDGVFRLLLLFWVAGNVFWAWGEIYYTDEVKGIPSGDPQKDLYREIPGMLDWFSASQLTVCWYCRWIGGWFVLAGLVVTAFEMMRIGLNLK